MKQKLLSILALLLTVTQGAWATGELTGVFSVSASKKVCFSKGNLQLVGANTWQFADNQWDYFGNTQSDNHRDLFGWGTKDNPNNTSSTNSDYSWNEWGENTSLVSSLGSGWHTLTSAEWTYLLTTREGTRYCKATVNSVSGLVIFPDSYSHPTELTAIASANTTNVAFTTNSWSGENWTKMETAGAVFLPAAGRRYSSGFTNTSNASNYWSSTPSGDNSAKNLRFQDNDVIDADYTSRYCGSSVRLVKEVYTATFADGNDLSALLPYAGKTCTVTYTRSFTAGKASTVCLPFAYTPQGEEKFYSFTGINEDGGNYTADMTEVVSPLVANTPYLFMPTGNADFSGTYAIPASITAGTTTSGAWTFIGTYSTIEWTSAPAKPTYGFSAQAANDGITQGQFVKVGSYVRIKPMRAYLQYNGSDSQFANAPSLTRAAATTSDDTLPETISVRLVSANGEVTAIGTLHTRTGEVSFDSEAWYTLDGKRLSGQPTTKGIYVNNGKKVVIK